MSAQQLGCHKCQHVWSFEPPLARRAECPQCHSDARVCRNCRFYDQGSHHECREEQAEWVKEKDRANFCGYFSPNARRHGESEEAKAKAKLAAMFGAKAKPAASPEASLEDELAKFIGKKDRRDKT